MVLCLLAISFVTGCGRQEGLLFGSKEAAAGLGLSESAAPSPRRSSEPEMDKMAEQAPLEESLASETAAPGTASAASATSSAAPAAPPARTRIYSGFCRLTVDDVEASKRQLGEFAEASGGYVESASGGTIVLRLPAARFRELFEQVLGFGEVTYRAVETQDVGDALRDLQGRLQVARSARERLYRLLERATDVEERLAILREIKRLSEEIERLRLSLESLERLVAFSRITVELEARLSAVQQGRESIPFPWIAGLDPLYGTLPERRPLPRQWRGLPGALGQDFAVLERRRGLQAETPEGTRLRIAGRRNQPRGDVGFWQKALTYHLGPFYRDSRMLEAGPFRGVLFTSKDREPFGYLVAVAAEGRGGRTLRVLEVFFPTLETMERRLPEVRSALESLEAAP